MASAVESGGGVERSASNGAATNGAASAEHECLATVGIELSRGGGVVDLDIAR